MIRHKSLFSQVLSLIDHQHFSRCVRALDAEKWSKGFTCWSHFVPMLFCQLARAQSLREITQGLRSCEGKLSHLGVMAPPKRSTLSYANAHRPWQLYRTALIAILMLKYLQMRSRINWALSNLVALLRWNLFTHRDLWAWIDQPFETPHIGSKLIQMELVLDSS